MKDIVQRTSTISIPLTSLLCMWLFGNLYESLVWNPGLLADPRPGSLVSAFAPGSPVFYYLPWAPACFVLAAIMRIRFRSQVPAGVRRIWTFGIAELAVALFVKILLIATVNPVFRDPDIPTATVHRYAVIWAIGNAVVVVALVFAVYAFTAWRRR